MNAPHIPDPTITRRALLGAGLSIATIAALAACTPTSSPGFVSPTSPAVAAAERARRGTGRVTNLTLNAAPSQLDLAGTTANTWSFGSIPAPVVRLSAGDTLRATVNNGLPDPTSVHWHGVALRNNMDGVPPITQAAIAPAKSFTYDFIAENPGTYWFHPHVGVQIDRGLTVHSSSMTPTSHSFTTRNGSSSWTTGSTASPQHLTRY